MTRDYYFSSTMAKSFLSRDKDCFLEVNKSWFLIIITKRISHLKRPLTFVASHFNAIDN